MSTEEQELAEIQLRQQKLAEARLHRQLAELEAHKSNLRKRAQRELAIGALLVALHIVLILTGVISWWEVFRSLLFVVGIFETGRGIWGYRTAHRLTLEDIQPDPKSEHFYRMMSMTKLTYTYVLLGCFILVFFAEIATGPDRSLQAAALVKPAVRKGEIWRLFTAPTMHVNFIHIWMNGQASIGFGRLMETIADRAYLPIVFLISAFFGSIFSVLLYPTTTSAGASGGLMGIVGFLAVTAVRRKDKLPKGFLNSILVNIFLVAAFGIVGFAVIDNGGHLGGLLGGAACGALLVDKSQDKLRMDAPVSLKLLGFLCLVIIIAISIFTIYKLAMSSG